MFQSSGLCLRSISLRSSRRLLLNPSPSPTATSFLPSSRSFSSSSSSSSGSTSSSSSSSSSSSPSSSSYAPPSTSNRSYEYFSFGNNCFGQLGIDSSERVIGVNQISSPLLHHSQPLSIAAGWSHVLLSFTRPTSTSLRHDVVSWGKNTFSNLALGRQTAATVASPAICSQLTGIPVTQVAAGRAHSLFLSKDREVFSIGGTGLGQVGTGMCGSEELFIEEIARIEKGGLFEKKRKDKSKHILKIKSGYDHNLALWNDGALYVWGSNGDSQLGYDIVFDPTIVREDDDVSDICFSTPKLVDFLEHDVSVVDIDAKYDNSTLLCADGRVITMGNNHFGQLGIGTKDEHPGTPQLVKGPLEEKIVKQIATGLGHVLALTEEGEVYAWGHNEQGQLGVGTRKPELLPRKIEALKGAKVKKIACGGSHSVVMLEDGGLLTFGSANHGQLGHNNTTDRSVPSVVKHLQHHLVHDVACGTDFTIVITHSG